MMAARNSSRRKKFDIDRGSFYLVCLFLFILPLREAIPAIGPVSIGRVFGVVLVSVLAARLWTIGLRRPTLFHALFAAFIGWAGLSLIWSPGLGRGVTLLARIGLGFVAAVAIWDIIETRQQLETALIALLSGALLVALFVLGDFAMGGIADRGSMRFGFNGAVISRRMVFCLPLAGYLFFRSSGRLVRGFALVFVVGSAVAMLAVVVRQGLVAFAIGGATFLSLEALRRWQAGEGEQNGLHVPRKLAATSGAAVAVTLAVGVVVLRLLPDGRTAHLTGISLSGRTDIWASGWAAFESANPLLGLGIASYNTVVGPASSIDFDTAVLWPHSSLVGVTVELGIIGLLLFLATAAAGLFAVGVRGKDWPLLLALTSIWAPLTIIADVHLDAIAWVLISLVLVASRIGRGTNRLGREVDALAD